MAKSTPTPVKLSSSSFKKSSGSSPVKDCFFFFCFSFQFTRWIVPRTEFKLRILRSMVWAASYSLSQFSIVVLEIYQTADTDHHRECCHLTGITNLKPYSAWGKKKFQAQFKACLQILMEAFKGKWPYMSTFPCAVSPALSSVMKKSALKLWNEDLILTFYTSILINPYPAERS